MSSGSSGSGLLVVMTNITSSVSLIVLNKVLFRVCEFPYAMALTLAHLTGTALLLHLSKVAGVFNVKHLPISDVVLLATLTLCSVCFMNQSLRHNTVGFHQLAKLLVIPTTVCIQRLAFKVKYSAPIKVSLVILIIGIGIATGVDLKTNVIGSAYACIAVLTTSMINILAGRKQREFHVNAMQLTYHQTPLSAAMLSVVLYNSAEYHSVTQFKFDALSIGLIILTTICGFAVNVSAYMVIGVTSSVSYQVIGHLKMVLVLLSGFFIFNEDLTAQTATGIIVAFVGMALYTYLSLASKSKQS